MNLDEFLSQKKRSLNVKEIEHIRDDFITLHCEDFLFRKPSEEFESMKETKEILESAASFVPNDKIKIFIDQFSTIKDDEIAFVFPRSIKNNYFIIQELLKNSKYTKILNNIFDDDDTINFITVFDKDNIEDIITMFYVNYSSEIIGEQFGGYKLYGYGLDNYATMLKYNQIVLDIRPSKYSRFQDNHCRKDVDPKRIVKIRQIVNLMITKGYFLDELDIFRNMYGLLIPFLQNEFLKQRNLVLNNPYDYQTRITNISSELVDNGIINPMWKSETELFKLVRKQYKTALYQYCPDWLLPQNLDIFIPELNIGIEYQGVQHYKSVEYFGGNEKLQRQIVLDQRKKEKCNENGLSLIEWKYDEEISSDNLKQKIGKVMSGD
ncbi:hypothetical protein [Clostridium sp. HBUAS56010]|uniref:hypothetical protein n=1 Tax=Clostridium sp. HBUAS56010 TaxID=2571127 RepID=UPI001178466D|nr:hypothetical protein [Clostridium sp. HBUAS56010]